MYLLKKLLWYLPRRFYRLSTWLNLLTAILVPLCIVLFIHRWMPIQPPTLFGPPPTEFVQEGSAKYGAIIKFGNLDRYDRPTYATIQVKYDQEPGTHNIKRPDKILTDPAGWRNYKVNHNWVYDRSHLVGWQFSGINDDLRNLIIGTRYLNRGTEKDGTDPSNPQGMLYYEKRLNNWVEANSNCFLILSVYPNYHNDEKVPRSITLSWHGMNPAGESMVIDIGGYSEIKDKQSTVTLKNESPSFTIDYQTANVTPK